MEIYFVGGYVRDTLMGRQAKDVDYVVTGSTPEQMIDLGYKQVGADFPVFLDEEGTEYALARKERKVGDGYHGFECDFTPDVTIEEDLSRRDLTINAMAMPLLSSSNEVIDPYGGKSDIEFQVLRHVSDAFAEDPVRILRLARFHARFGPAWQIAPETAALCRRMIREGQLKHLTRERVLLEFEKALSEPYAYLFFQTLRSLGALQDVMTAMDFPQNWDYYELFSSLEPDASVETKVITLLYKIGEERAESLIEELRMQNHWVDLYRMYFAYKQLAQRPEVIDVLYDIGAYRKPKLFKNLVELVRHQDPAIIALSCIFAMSQRVTFDTLSPEQKATLQGPEIGEAIRQARRELCQM